MTEKLKFASLTIENIVEKEEIIVWYRLIKQKRKPY